MSRRLSPLARVRRGTALVETNAGSVEVLSACSMVMVLGL
jgi:hypothetical protein